MIKEITVQELKKLKEEQASFFLLDVREQHEYDTCHLDGYLIPLKELPQRLEEISKKDHPIIVHCKMGGRSARAVEFLQQHGFNNVYNLKGGIIAWIHEIDSSMKAY